MVFREALIRFSSDAESRLKKNPHYRNYYVDTTYAPESAVLHLSHWMQAQAGAEKPGVLTHPRDIDQILWDLQICQQFGAEHDVRGDELETVARLYKHMATLTVEEFATVCEVVPFVKGLQKQAVRETEGTLRTEGKKGVPNCDKIEAYCVQNGIVMGNRLVRIGIASGSGAVQHDHGHSNDGADGLDGLDGQ